MPQPDFAMERSIWIVLDEMFYQEFPKDSFLHILVGVCPPKYFLVYSTFHTYLFKFTVSVNCQGKDCFIEDSDKCSLSLRKYYEITHFKYEEFPVTKEELSRVCL